MKKDLLLTASDIDIAARTLWGEARGEDHRGRLAVAHVLINRWKTNKGQFRKDDTLATACLRHVQFSVWNQRDGNFKKLFSVDMNTKAFRECMGAILEALDGDDLTFGSRHYHTVAIKPGWAKGHKPAFSHGNHIFYNDVD